MNKRNNNSSCTNIDVLLASSVSNISCEKKQMSMFKKLRKRIKGEDNIKPQIIPHDKNAAAASSKASKLPETISTDQGQFPVAAQTNRTRSNAEPVMKQRPLLQVPSTDARQTKDNSLAQSMRLDTKVHVRSSKEAENRQSRPSILSSRRKYDADLIAQAMLMERGDSSEDSPKAHQMEEEKGTVIESSNDFQNFDDLQQSFRGGQTRHQSKPKAAQSVALEPNKSPLLESFDVVQSPDVVSKQMEEEKGAIIQIEKKGAYNIASNKNHFDQIRDAKNTLRDTIDWQKEAAEDSDEEYQPLASIIPDHMKRPDELAAKPKDEEPRTGLEQQMFDMDRLPSSAAVSFDLGGVSQRIKSQTEHESRPSSKRPDVERNFMHSLVIHNSLADSTVEEQKVTTSVNSSEKEMREQAKEFAKLQEEMQQEMANSSRKTATLVDNTSFQPAIRKRTVLVTSEVDSSEMTIGGGTSDTTSRRIAVYRKSKYLEPSELPSQDSQVTSDLEKLPSEKSYDSESDIDLEEIEEAEREEEEQRQKQAAIEKAKQDEDFRKAGVGPSFLDDLLSENIKEKKEEEKSPTQDLDMIQLVDESEHLFIRFAQQKLVDNKVLLNERALKALEGLKRKELVEQRVLSEVCPRNYGQFDAQFSARRQAEQDSCIAVSDEVIVIGTHQGTFNCYNRETCRPYGRFEDTGSDFENNPVTCMNIHPLRTEYVVAGFGRGQFMIVDLSLLDQRKMMKPKKVVKDHHRGHPLVSVKFCDWIREREVTEESKGAPSQQDVQAWMIASVDSEGCVVISCVRNVALGILKASKLIILDPRQQAEPLSLQARFAVVEPRFYSIIFPQGEYNDTQTWLAVANYTEVQILNVTKQSCSSVFSISKPTFYPSDRTQKYEAFPNELPVLTWGYGRSPCFKHRMQTMLAIAWGPLIQIVLLIPDDEKTKSDTHFRMDGQYFIAPGAVQDMVSNTSQVRDLRVESMKFLAESVLFVYTSTHDIRVLHTQSFKDGSYKNPSIEQLADPTPKFQFDKMDSRLRLLEANSALTKEQRTIEMERRKFLSHPLLVSLFGGRATQTLTSFNDWVIFMTEAGYRSVQHMTWQEYVETSEQDMDSTWIDTFKKTLDIYDGKIKGFKGVVDDRDLRQESMKAELKLLVTDLIDKLIAQWQVSAQKMEKAGTPQNEVVEHFQNKQRALIKRSIEMCVDIWEPFFLFNNLFQKFVEQGMQSLFAEELKPYILSGTFSDTDMPETILVHHILKHPYERFQEQEKEQKNNSPSSGELASVESPAESFEKIIVNLSFHCCSPEYQLTLLNFAKEKKLSTGHFYLAVNYAGDDGVRVALHQLRTFYLQFKEEEMLSSSASRQVMNKEDLYQLKGLPADMQYREVYEKSASYIGYKLLWAIRLTLLGKRFPKGHYETGLWQNIVHEVLDIITQEDFMKTLLEVDASAYFQIITIAFINPSVQYNFLKKGRGPQVNLLQEAKQTMSHAELVRRISDYCLLNLEEGSETRLQYLFFIASIAEEDQQSRDQAFYFKVTLELIKHSTQFMRFNKSLIQRQMTQKQMYRKLSRKGVQAPDQIKHVVLSEESIMVLVRKCEPLPSDQINMLVEMIAETTFDSLKLMLYEKQEAYTKCLKLLVERESVSTFVTVKMRDRFAWIIQTYFMLESRLGSRNENTHNRYQFDLFEQEIFTFAHILTKIDSHKAVGLIDCLFKDQVSQHLAFVLKMTEHPKEQFQYTNKLLEINIDQAKTTMTEYSLQQKMASQASDWLKILNINLELACQLEPESVVRKIKANLKQNFYPAEECLKICLKYERTEASAILCKKAGRYKEAVQHYIDLINQTINTKSHILLFKKELYDLDRHIRVTLLKQKKMLADKEMQAKMRVQADLFSSQHENLDVGRFQQLSLDIDQLIENSRTDLVPVAYSKEFSAKEKFVDAIQLKVFIGSKCENVSLLERVLKILMKMFKSHPDEVLRTSNEIWLMVIQMMFRLTQHPELHRKRYCRRYLIVKMVTLVREILKHISLKFIIEGILKVNKQIKFRAVKQLISDVFWDKRAEVDLCLSGQNIAFNVLKETQAEFFTKKGDGLVFNYTKCDICQQDVSKTSMRALNSFSRGTKAAKDEMNLLLFDCSKERDYNHTYHEHCLKKFIKEELRKDKKASLNDQNVFSMARCVICFKQSQNIKQLGAAAEERPERRRPGASRAGRATPLQRQATELEENASSISSQDASRATAPASRVSQMRSTFEEEQSQRISKKLILFEKELAHETLKTNNFTSFD